MAAPSVPQYEMRVSLLQARPPYFEGILCTLLDYSPSAAYLTPARNIACKTSDGMASPGSRTLIVGAGSMENAASPNARSFAFELTAQPVAGGKALVVSAPVPAFAMYHSLLVEPNVRASFLIDHWPPCLVYSMVIGALLRERPAKMNTERPSL